MLNLFLFVIFPYVALTLMVVVSIYRFFNNSYKFSSLSSEFLESDKLFWGSVPWHYGIIILFFGHLIGFICPEHIRVFAGVPLRLLILELTALVFGLLTLFGLVMLIKRRLIEPTIKAVTTPMDFFILFVLLIQVLAGVGIAVMHRWGILWYTTSMVPYLKSIFTLKPDMIYIMAMPTIVKVHVVNAFFIIALIPFTRLVHFLILPIPYIWRSWQIVIWNYDRKEIRKVE